MLKSIIAAIAETIRTHRAPKKYAEPIRVIANKVSSVAVLLAGALAYAQAHVDLVPAKYHAETTGAILFLGGAVAFVVKISSEVMRSKVFSPATHEAELTAASEASYRTQVQTGTVVDPSQFSPSTPSPDQPADPEALPKVDANGDLVQ